MMRLFASTTNFGKLAELALAAGPAFEIAALPGISQLVPPEETGASFEANAMLKAIYYSQLTPELVLADDSGLEVDALGGAPGILSARYAGPYANDEQNNNLLLMRLADVNDRSAHFSTSIALARNGECLAIAHGRADGRILLEPRGSGGFGYDPLFFYPPLKRSFAELSGQEKFTVSARGQAIRSLLRSLASNPLAATAAFVSGLPFR